MHVVGPCEGTRRCASRMAGVEWLWQEQTRPPLSVFLPCLISRKLRRIRVEAVHKFSIEKIVEGGLYGSSRKYKSRLVMVE